MSEVHNIAMTFDIPLSLKQRLEEYKEKTGLPQAVVIRKALLRYLETHKLVEVELTEDKAA